ncbi:hypothetical protein EH223_14500 [candidate division KSB1 bacterium]|nr:hypothetical protein [candidate division KSB1 bacterium]RQW01636.1 MAG: hypothetical protein EH223_14500 [candidate division KSB1 bacterium]
MKRLLILFLFFTSCSQKQQSQIEINFDHLFKLTETVTLDGKECDIIHIYSEYPDYKWVDASSEGIACVDDAARAVVLYVRYYEITHDETVLSRAKRLLNFILFMQADDGEFYNFIDKDLHINTTGKTSRKIFGFWAVRAYWAIGIGFRVFKEKDPDYAAELETAFLKCQHPLNILMQHYGKYELRAGKRYPQWLIYKTGSDAAATLVLALVEYMKCEQNQHMAEYATKLAEGIMDMQVHDDSKRNGAFLSWPDTWHAWGNVQTLALASLGAFGNPRFIHSAQKEADNYYAYLLRDGMKSSWRYSQNEMKEFPQIAYDIRCMAVGLLRLADATDNTKYSHMAGHAAAWLVGKNAAKQMMYDSHSGRCLDGINDSSSVNLNSGAESTIEALFTLVEISNHSIARNILEQNK